MSRHARHPAPPREAEPGAPSWWRGLTAPLRALPRAQRLALLWLLTAGAAAAMLSLRMVQPEDYHRFADTRPWLGVPNFLNVVSNLPFMLVGAAALWNLRGSALQGRPAGWIWRVFFLGMALTGAGSAWYHWAPDHHGLFWDRLGMSVGFAAFAAGVCADRFGAAIGTRVFVLAVLAMAGGALWWRASFGSAENVAPYLFAMYGGAVISLYVVLAFPSRQGSGHHAFIALAFFAVAMLFDAWLDGPLLTAGGLLSGHSFKHLLGALAAGWVWWFMLRPGRIADQAPLR
ncbi:MAG TPA: hypothetical protein VFP70_10615 [Burkholderiales bacterium]|nr:hypothetical protein [Burkholderiales bacterium]